MTKSPPRDPADYCEIHPAVYTGGLNCAQCAAKRFFPTEPPSTSDAEEMKKAASKSGFGCYLALTDKVDPVFEKGWKAGSARAEGEIEHLKQMNSIANHHFDRAVKELADLKAKLAEEIALRRQIGEEIGCMRESLAASDVGKEEALDRDAAVSRFIENYLTMNNRPVHRPDVLEHAFLAGWDAKPSPPISSLPADEIAKHPLVRELIKRAKDQAYCNDEYQSAKQQGKFKDFYAHWVDEGKRRTEYLQKALAPFRKGGAE